MKRMYGLPTDSEFFDVKALIKFPLPETFRPELAHFDILIAAEATRVYDLCDTPSKQTYVLYPIILVRVPYKMLSLYNKLTLNILEYVLLKFKRKNS